MILCEPGDVVVIALTSQDQGADGLLLTDWKLAGLPKQTWVKPLVATVAGALIEKRLGSLVAADEDCLREAVVRAIHARLR
jgi:hypothetical protein